jgi:hypothetical protein
LGLKSVLGYALVAPARDAQRAAALAKLFGVRPEPSSTPEPFPPRSQGR